MHPLPHRNGARLARKTVALATAIAITKPLAKPSQKPRTITTTNPSHLPLLAASKKDWAAFRRRRHSLNTRRSHKMTHKFDEHDATDLSRIIRRRRPHWNHNGIMGFLQQAALRGASLTQVMAAAEKTWTNQKATTPAAILWPEHWEPDKPRTAGNLMGQMLCVECTPARKHPVTQMTKQPHGWVCNQHQEES